MCRSYGNLLKDKTVKGVVTYYFIECCMSLLPATSFVYCFAYVMNPEEFRGTLLEGRIVYDVIRGEGVEWIPSVR